MKMKLSIVLAILLLSCNGEKKPKKQSKIEPPEIKVEISKIKPPNIDPSDVLQMGTFQNLNSDNSIFTQVDYKRLRAELVENYEDYVKIMTNRKDANQRAAEIIQEDFRYVIANKDLKSFIDACPRISKNNSTSYFEGMGMILSSLREDL